MSKLAEKVQQELLRAIDNDELVLPTLPEVALRVREAAEDPDISIQDLANIDLTAICNLYKNDPAVIFEYSNTRPFKTDEAKFEHLNCPGRRGERKGKKRAAALNFVPSKKNEDHDYLQQARENGPDLPEKRKK